VRLTGSTVSNEGRLELFKNGTWAGVSYGGVGSTAFFANQVCRELGFSRGRPFVGNFFTRTGLPVWGSAYCRGDEATVAWCSYSMFSQIGGGRGDLNIACTNSTKGEPCGCNVCSVQWCLVCFLLLSFSYFPDPPLPGDLTMCLVYPCVFRPIPTFHLAHCRHNPPLFCTTSGEWQQQLRRAARGAEWWDVGPCCGI